MTTVKLPQMDMTSLDTLTKATLSATETYFRSLSEIAKLAFAMNPLTSGFTTKQCGRCGSRHMGQCGSCDIPEPCWLPRCLGDIRSFVCPGGTASIRIQVTNCQPRSSTINVTIPRRARNRSMGK